jgi:hypothetical protein
MVILCKITHIGVRTFFFDAVHFRGEVKLFENKKHPYVDFAFATKQEMNRYFNSEYYYAIIDALKEYN